jgi:hypothetical protein
MAIPEHPMQSTGAPPSSTLTGPPPGGGLGRSRKRFDLLEECRELILVRLTEVIAQALNRISEELTTEGLRAKNPERQKALLDAGLLVRENRAEIETRFRRSFGDVFERRLFATHSPQEGEAGPNEELSLIPVDALTDRLSVDRLIGRARDSLDPHEVLGIRARLGALLERDWFEETEHPVSPEAVFEALRSALAELSPRPEVKAALLDAFEPHVSQNLNEIYAAVNERLRAEHVLPKIKLQFLQTASGAQASTPGEMATDGFHRSTFSPDDTMASLQQAMAAASEGRPAGRMHVARMLSNPTVFGVSDNQVAPVEQPLVASLTALQRGALPTEAGAMLPEIAQRVREQGSPLDQITVEIVSMVFDYIYADRRLPDAIKQQLLRLQVVAVKAALLDRSFFARRQHPMRRLIDLISDVGADPDADLAPGAPLIEGLGGVVDKVIAGFDADLGVFDQAIESIEALAAEEAARRSTAFESTAHDAAFQEAVAIAQDEARIELGRRLDKDSPPFLREFLNRWWSLVLAQLRASHAGAAAQQAWEMGLRTADYLVWSVAPKHSDEITRLATILPGLIRGLNQGLATVEIYPAERGAFFDELLRAHTLEIAAVRKRATTAQSAQAAKSAESARAPVAVRLQEDGTVRFVAKKPEAPAAQTPPPASAVDTLLESLQRGQKIELVGDEGARVLKLAWISPARRLFILTRHPEESLKLQGNELAFMLQQGQARIVNVDSALDRAIGSVTGDTPRPEDASQAPAEAALPNAPQQSAPFRGQPSHNGRPGTVSGHHALGADTPVPGAEPAERRVEPA